MNTQHKTETKTVLQKENNFSEWYSEILKRAEILDVRYPVKGVYVWYPYGYKLRNLTYAFLRSLMDKDHEETLFPMLIPKEELMKEREHIKGFEEEVFWVTKAEAPNWTSLLHFAQLRRLRYIRSSRSGSGRIATCLSGYTR